MSRTLKVTPPANTGLLASAGKSGTIIRQEAMDEKTAIAVLKKKGYRVMKKTTAYIDL